MFFMTKDISSVALAEAYEKTTREVRNSFLCNANIQSSYALLVVVAAACLPRIKVWLFSSRGCSCTASLRYRNFDQLVFQSCCKGFCVSV